MRKGKLMVVALTMFFLFSMTGMASAALNTAFTMDGNIGAEVAAFPAAGVDSSGTLNLSTIPAGASIIKATLYANNYFDSTVTPSAIFAGNPLGATAAFATDLGFSAFQWDVSGLVAGNGSYNASYAGTSNSYGLALVVVFGDPSLPLSRVTINDGAIDLPISAGSTSFNASAGPGTLWIHTLADNNGGFNQSGEQIVFNGNVVGGPIDANLGAFASLFQLPVTTVNGVNTATILDPLDNFGWDLTVLTSAASPAPVPASLLLLGSGLLGLVGLRSRLNK